MMDEYGPLPEGEDLAETVRVHASSFGTAPEDSVRYLETVGLENLRVLRVDGRVVATTVLLPMGQFFGGRSVPCTGIASVAVSPEHRGSGCAQRVMSAALAEARSSGAALCTLYASVPSLYRKVGFERAGSSFDVRVPMRDLALGERSLEVRRAEDVDPTEIEALHDRCVADHAGHFDRHPDLWRRVRRRRDGAPIDGYAVFEDSALAGYVHFLVAREAGLSGGPFDLALTDFVATSRASAARLLTLLGDHGSLGRDARWCGGPGDAVLALVAQSPYTIKLWEHWMTRVVDVAHALQTRGYPRGLETDLELEIRDELFPENNGPLHVTIADGRAQVSPGGRGSLALDVRGLAPLFTGFLSPQALASVGLVDGAREELERAAAVFAGPAPTTPDRF